jgi:hypothetical protein
LATILVAGGGWSGAPDVESQRSLAQFRVAILVRLRLRGAGVHYERCAASLGRRNVCICVMRRAGQAATKQRDAVKADRLPDLMQGLTSSITSG